ncbi:MAG: saccharopine dehydrogenase NADP-binding domain-containing protein [Bacteroidota bacterium]
MKFLLYGAYGYTGRLIARFAQEQGMEPILAGRNGDKLQAMGSEFGFETRVFDLSDTQALEAALGEVSVVLHCAGPFIHTAQIMMEACLRTQTHYLDITGEIQVFEMGKRRDEQAQQAGIMIMPGTGFDVVPTDCLARFLKEQLPDATHLQLAFAGNGGLSHGTALTMLENLGSPGAIRKDGKITPVPQGYKAKEISFKLKPRFCMTIPWGDVSTAYYSTGIPNIEVYTGVKPSSYKLVKRQRYFTWLLRMPWVKNQARKRIKKGPAGPSDAKREGTRTQLWGKVSNAKGQEVEAQMLTAEGYTLTALSCLAITQRVLNGHAPIGFQTPAKAYGSNLIMEFEGSERNLVDRGQKVH